MLFDHFLFNPTAVIPSAFPHCNLIVGTVVLYLEVSLSVVNVPLLAFCIIYLVPE